MIVEDVESFRINFASVNPLDMFDSSQTVLVYIQDDDGTIDMTNTRKLTSMHYNS